ncbi:MAG: TRAP transporter small permease [Syntrophaceae bacterium]|nr:TRAP transporter small permease [Syntrophaceae bacterium]
MERLILFHEENLKKWGVYIISTPLIVMTIVEVLNAFGRKLFIPFPCCLEAVESLLVISVYFGVSIVAMEGGHVNVTIMTRKLPNRLQHALDAFANLLGMSAFGFLSVGAWAEAFRALRILEMRIGVYRFPLWPFKLLFAVGISFLTIQLAINAIKFVHFALGHSTYAGAKAKQEAEVLMEM